MKVKIEIKNRFTGKVLFELETDNNTIKQTLEKAKEEDADLRDADLRDADLRGADLRGADLYGADLYGADLRDADLRDADLRDADLRGADLYGADLRDADLRGADLYGADLEGVKKDMFDVLLRGISEIKYLKQSIIEGKIDGSVYDGECCCLNGTLCKNNPNKYILINSRNPNRPIERFFLGIKKGDTPETSQFSKLALEWVEEFESFINTYICTK